MPWAGIIYFMQPDNHVIKEPHAYFMEMALIFQWFRDCTALDTNKYDPLS